MSKYRDPSHTDPPPLAQRGPSAEVIPLRTGGDAFLAERRTASKQQFARLHAMERERDGEPAQLSLDVDIPIPRLPLAGERDYPPERLPLARHGDMAGRTRPTTPPHEREKPDRK